ncbi:MAG: ABC transporter substrate-binding protein [Desulfobacteraceae bacterium]|nr:ABC transporter substrate-binding protein [Desulfobacteraceae bacterium]
MPDKPVIRVGCLRTADHLIAGVTKERLEKKDVDFSFFEMDLVVMNALEEVSDLLVKGEIDGAYVPLPFSMDLFRRGLDIKLLLFTNRGGGSIVKNKAACIKRVQGFKNKIILTPCLLSVQNMLLHKIFFSAGLTFGHGSEDQYDVLLEVVPSNIIAEMLENDSDNEIGGFVTQEPFGIKAIKYGDCEEFCKFDSLWQGHPDSVFVLRDSVIKNNPEHVRELVRAFIESGEIIAQSNDDNLRSYVETFFRHDRKIVNSLHLAIKGMFAKPKFLPDYSVMEIVQDYMVDQAGLMAGKIDIKKFIDAGFAE